MIGNAVPALDQQVSQAYWGVCPDCQGRGKKSKRIRKKAKLQYQRELAQFTQQGEQGKAPTKPKGHLDACKTCKGAGVLPRETPLTADTEHFPHIAIIGGGIGGVALAVACLHRGIPFTLFERDNSFDERSQGYGLTLQQASRAMDGLGITELQDGVISTRHVVHNTEGKVLGEWGNRKWVDTTDIPSLKRTNIHIARQALRFTLLQQLTKQCDIQWGHQLIDFADSSTGDNISLSFQVDGQLKQTTADLVVGADGIRSCVRQKMIEESLSPLSYLGCIVILGICPLSSLKEKQHPLLDSATVFQTANGHERIYIMPYDAQSVMWQLSFPMQEAEAKKLSQQGPEALKKEALLRCQWHSPIPDILSTTAVDKISGYPVYDRTLLNEESFSQSPRSTLIGDAAHPMSPFKGQGANQALLDALSLARIITKQCRPFSHWREEGIRKAVLNEFEAEMLQRSAVKVKDSAKAAEFLHTDVALHESDEPRGRCLQKGPI